MHSIANILLNCILLSHSFLDHYILFGISKYLLSISALSISKSSIFSILNSSSTRCTFRCISRYFSLQISSRLICFTSTRIHQTLFGFILSPIASMLYCTLTKIEYSLSLRYSRKPIQKCEPTKCMRLYLWSFFFRSFFFSRRFFSR